ncbi:MAG: hypothetical protein ACNI27_06205 [Desulfovibrio sp.]
MPQALMQLEQFKQVMTLMSNGKEDLAHELMRSLQQNYIALLEENEALRMQLEEVADILDLSDCINFDGQKYWIEEENEKTGPYCQLCYDKDAQLIRLQERPRHWFCACCNNLYIKQTEPAQPALSTRLRERILRTPVPLFVK